MDLQNLIQHPEQMDKETLYDLRSLLALYPYFQTARLLLLQNLYLLHDPTFDEELRRAAIYISDRRVIFNLVEAAHYRLRNNLQQTQKPKTKSQDKEGSRTVTLIDQFLETIPVEDADSKKKRKPTPADAAVDYVSYLLEIEGEEEAFKEEEQPQMKGQNLIDNFINNEGGNFELKEVPEFLPLLDENEKNEENSSDEGYFTETLARIYIKQGRYSKALEIIKRLNLNYPKKNVYFADQIRFNFSSSNQIMGVRKTTDFIEKATWGLAAAMVVLSVVCAYVAPTASTSESVLENVATEQQQTNPNTLPGFGASQSGDQKAAPAKDAAPAQKAPATPATPAK